MAMYLNGVEIPEPKDFTIDEFDIENSQRLASGRMVFDWIATKKTFNLSYPFARYGDMTGFFSAFDLKDFFTFTYYDKGSTAQTATVRMNKLSRKLMTTDSTANNWLYSGFTITLEEQ